MFKILSKEDATPAELAESYVEVHEAELKLTGEMEAIGKEVISLQQRQMAGESVKTDLGKKKNAHDDLFNMVAACRDALQKIRTRLESAIPAEKKARQTAIDAEVRDLQKEFDEGLRAVLDAYGRAYSMDAELRRLSVDRPKITLDAGELRGYYDHFVDAVREFTDDGQQMETPIKVQIERLKDEHLNLNRDLINYDPENAVQEILKNAGLPDPVSESETVAA